jgi:hypothetical protein
MGLQCCIPTSGGREPPDDYRVCLDRHERRCERGRLAQMICAYVLTEEAIHNMLDKQVFPLPMLKGSPRAEWG